MQDPIDKKVQRDRFPEQTVQLLFMTEHYEQLLKQGDATPEILIYPDGTKERHERFNSKYTKPISQVMQVKLVKQFLQLRPTIEEQGRHVNEVALGQQYCSHMETHAPWVTEERQVLEELVHEVQLFLMYEQVQQGAEHYTQIVLLRSGTMSEGQTVTHAQSEGIQMGATEVLQVRQVEVLFTHVKHELTQGRQLWRVVLGIVVLTGQLLMHLLLQRKRDAFEHERQSKALIHAEQGD